MLFYIINIVCILFQKKFLTNLDVSRYSRQIILPEIGIEGILTVLKFA